MPGLSRVMLLCSFAVLTVILPSAQEPSEKPPMGFAEAVKQADSLAKARRNDSMARAADSLRDTVPPAPLVYRWDAPDPMVESCPEALETVQNCWRRHPLLANQDIGFPGPRAWTLSLTNLEPIPFRSPYFPAYGNSPYRLGGILPTERFALRRAGGDASALEDIWTPVVPLDTPETNLEWERGALALNMFHLKLRRMLSDRVYLGLDYYSASGDSQQYDYQFNVHQPYLSGWGFLGRIYAPIDRDSASLVLEGVSHAIGALNFRPRIGFWLDTNQVMEVFLDRVKNTTSLTWPRRPGASDTLGPADSVQSFMPSSLTAYTGGAIHGMTGRGWTSQWEAAATALEKSTRRDDTGSVLTGGGIAREDAWEGSLFKARGRMSAPGWPGRPFFDAEAVSENWSGRLFPDGAGRGLQEEGWTDRQDFQIGLRPEILSLDLEVDAGIGRSSRMDNRVFWLPHGGALAELDLPLGLKGEAGAAYRMRDADWETLYRHNPGLFLHPSPDLEPRTDLSYRASVSWMLPFIRLEAGADFARGEDVWLPWVLPSGDACASGVASAYSYPAACDAGHLPDSLALRLRNWGSEERDMWHMALGLDLGNWRLDLRNRFLFNSKVEDPLLDGSLANRMVPDRVFKGDLGWKRSLLDGKLKVAVGWGWEWFSTRHAWVPDLLGRSRPGKLDEYLAMDFQASMRIRTFLLYFKGVNFNHDRYATEPGVHPPGVNFRFGIDWTIWN